MASPSSTSSPSLERIFSLLGAFHNTAASRTGIERDVFTAIGNIFHHFDSALCEKLMRSVHPALKFDGKAVTLEFIPNEDRATPPGVASFSLNMLVETEAGDAYTFSKYARMFASTGFGKTTLHEVSGMPQRLLISEKNK
jgi:O-methyltransferase domain